MDFETHVTKELAIIKEDVKEFIVTTTRNSERLKIHKWAIGILVSIDLLLITAIVTIAIS